MWINLSSRENITMIFWGILSKMTNAELAFRQIPHLLSSIFKNYIV